MLDDFKEEQGVVYNIIKSSISSNRCSHAYLINTNGYSKGFDFVLALAKYILCPNCICSSDCSLCNQCRQIDNNSFSELKVLKYDGLWIKKEETDLLQTEFSKTSINSNKKVYIINGVENLNVSASNSILKFLEEPEDGIVALLITDNIYKVLNTIVSRCQVLNLRNITLKSDNMLVNVANMIYNDSSLVDSFISDENSINIINSVIDFIIYLEDNHFNTIIYIDKLWNNFFSSKEDFLLAFNIMSIFYNDVIHLKMGNSIILTKYSDFINRFVFLDFNDINKRINLIISFRDRLYSNVNLGLLMDKFIIEMGRLYE